MSRLLCAGCTGLIGHHLLGGLAAGEHHLIVLSRDPEAARERLAADLPPATVEWRRWDGEQVPEGLEQVDAVVNLCGSGIADQRWSDARKRELRDSRIGPGRALAAFVAEHAVPLLIQASAVGWYGERTQPVDEQAPAGTGFLAGLTAEWERASLAAQAHARVVLLRLAPVLTPRDGMLAKLLPPLIPLAWLGSGRQAFPWIHVDDVVGMIAAALDQPAWDGPINAVAPELVDQRGFVRCLGRVEHRPVMPLGIPAPALRLGLGQLSTMLLTGAPVMPAKAEALDYAWRQPRLEAALAACRDARKGT